MATLATYTTDKGSMGGVSTETSLKGHVGHVYSQSKQAIGCTFEIPALRPNLDWNKPGP